jgi:hypothetical protein
MSSSLKRIGRLAPAVAAITLACIFGAQAAAKPGMTATAAMARHFQHEDAIYDAKDRPARPRTPAQAMVLHFNHEDAIYGGNLQVRSSRSPAEQIALHLRHEDALYSARKAAVAVPTAAAPSGGFDWNDALIGAGGAVAVMLLSASAVVAVRRSRRLLAES